MFDLINKIAVVTGASSGIGKAIATGLLNERSMVCAVGRSLEKLKSSVGCIGLPSNNIFLYTAELENDHDIRALTLHIQQNFKGIDILVHSAGLISTGNLEQASIDNFDRQYRVNVRAPYLLTQALLPALRSRSGQVVFINSSAWFAAKAGVGQYAATKYALKAIADSLRDEVNADGVRVLSVYPGQTASPMQETIHAMKDIPYRPENLMQPEDVASAVIGALTLPRTAEITDIYMRPLKLP